MPYSRMARLGEQFTDADVVCGAHIGWCMMFKMIPERPEFTACAARIAASRRAARRGEGQGVCRAAMMIAALDKRPCIGPAPLSGFLPARFARNYRLVRATIGAG